MVKQAISYYILDQRIIHQELDLCHCIYEIKQQSALSSAVPSVSGFKIEKQSATPSVVPSACCVAYMHLIRTASLNTAC